MMKESCFLLIALLWTGFASSAAQFRQQEGQAASSRQPPAEEIHRIGDEGVEPPQLIRKTMPDYTPEAKRNRVEGAVLLEAVVRKDGSIDSFKVLESPGYGLDKQAIEEISKHWKFESGSLDGKPVDVRVTIEVTFTLR